MNKPNRFVPLLIVSLFGFIGNATATSEPLKTNLPPGTGIVKVNAPLSAGNSISTPGYLTYKYFADRYRDPFIPLNSDARGDLYDRPPQTAALTLKGIIQDSSGRIALLTTGPASYTLKGGRLYDGKSRAVKGMSGVVKANSVILIGADRTVRELRVVTAL